MGGAERLGDWWGHDVAGPVDRRLGEVGDGQPSLCRPGPEALGELVDPRTAVPEATEIVLGGLRVGKDGAGGDGEQRGWPDEGHRCDRELGAGQLELAELLLGRRNDGAEGDRVVRRELGVTEPARIGQHRLDLGTATTLALLAVVGHPVVAPRDAQLAGEEGMGVQPFLVVAVGEASGGDHGPPSGVSEPVSRLTRDAIQMPPAWKGGSH